MSTTESCILAAIIVLIVLAVAFFIHRSYMKSRPASKGSFMPGDPATPKLREAVALLSGDLSCICRTFDSVQDRARQIESAYGAVDMGPAFNEARLSLTAARRGMDEIASGAKRLRARVGAMAPTYQNVLGLYQGLRDSDKGFWAAAQALDAAGERMQNLVSSTDDHTNTAQPHVLELKTDLGSAATQLRQVSTCLYSLVRTVHYLGSALQLE